MVRVSTPSGNVFQPQSGYEVALSVISELADIVRKRARRTPRHCEEEGNGANPSSSEVHGDDVEGHLEVARKRASVQLTKPLDLGAGEPVSPPPIRTHNRSPLNQTHSGELDMHIERLV